MHKIFLVILSLSFVSIVYGQKELVPQNQVYKKNIKSVQILVNGVINSVPVVRLNSSDQLKLQFDDLGDQSENDYYYRIVLCDRDWNIASNDPIEYVDGFADSRVVDWQTSIGTLIDFTHYWVNIPNRDTRIKVSGNYIFYIYNSGDEEEPILSQRFVVAEGLIGVTSSWTRPTKTEIIRFGQQMNLDVLIKNVKIQNPMRDVTTTIIQNGLWSHAITKLSPRSVQDNLFSFDKFGTISFMGNNEFRCFDTRRLNSRGIGVKLVDRSQDLTEVTLYPTERRDEKVYILNYDFNGKFYISNNDDYDRLLFSESTGIFDKNRLAEFRNNFAYHDETRDVWQIREKDVRADYVNVIFTLRSGKLDEDVFVLGAFTDYQLREDYKMRYDDIRKMYVLEAVLKQGYYDYFYAYGEAGKKPEFQLTEGSWQDTENEYTLLVYYREFGSRTDRVLGAYVNNTGQF